MTPLGRRRWLALRQMTRCGAVRALAPPYPGVHNARTRRGLPLACRGSADERPMNDVNAPQHDGRHGDGRRAGRLVGRESELDRLRAFLATARSDGSALLVT